MLRATATQLQQTIANQFGLTAIDAITSGPRDVLYVVPEIALRARQEQCSELGLDPEQNMPFLSFYRTGYQLNKPRLNLPLITDGAFTDDNRTRKYKMRPVRFVFQIEHWSDKPEDFEEAIENFYKWSVLPGELVLTDTEGVTFQLPINFDDVQDNSRLRELFDIGPIYRATMPVVVSGYIITENGPFTTIHTITWNIWDYSAYGNPDRAILIKSGEVVGPESRWDVSIWDQFRWDKTG